MRAWWSKIARAFGRRSGLAEELNEEMQAHLEFLIERNVERGMSAKEARDAARREFGNATLVRERSYESWQFGWFETLIQDVRYALRGFRRNPAFTVTAILTLALAIGATTAVFSVVDLILFRALPYAHADRIVSVGLVQSLEHEEFMMGGFYFDWLDHQRPFAAMAAQGISPHACDLVENNPSQLGCIHIQAGFLPMLGVSPALGRNFLPYEDEPRGPRVALISYSLWSGHYNRDPGILNREIDIDGLPTRVVGVLPKSFELPTLEADDVFFPMQLTRAEQNKINHGIGYPMRAFARLKPGVSIAQARAEMEPLFLQTQQTLIPPPIRNDFHLSIRSLRDRETQGVQLAAWVLFCAVLAVLLVTCANVASLMMARAAARERELAVRAALGASRLRLIRQTLTEALLLSLAGAGAGMALAEALLRGFLIIAPTGIPFLGRARLDLRIAFFTMLLALACAAIFGLLPALEKPRSLAFAAHAPNSARRAVIRRILVAGQIAVSVILLTGAALLLRSFAGMEQQRLGVQTHGILSVNIALPKYRYNTGKKKMQFYLQVEAAARRLPGVRAVGWSDSLPPGGWSMKSRLAGLTVAGRPHSSEGLGGPVITRTVTRDYFRALDIPIFRGRNFTEEDRASGNSLMIVSRLLAARLFPGEDPIGQRIGTTPVGPWYTVVGEAQDVKNNSLTGQELPEIDLLRRSIPNDWLGHGIVGSDMSGGAPMLIIDAVVPPKVLAPWIRAEIAHLDPTVPINISSLNERIGELAARPRFEAALLGFFAFVGLVMAIIGLYGIIASLTAQRTKEIGVRMAMGATRFDILRLVLREGLLLTAFGGVAGLVAAFGLSHILKSLLYSVRPHDPVSFIAVALLLVLVALVAMLIPARAAIKTDPVEALRYE